MYSIGMPPGRNGGRSIVVRLVLSSAFEAPHRRSTALERANCPSASARIYPMCPSDCQQRAFFDQVQDRRTQAD